MKRRKYRKFAKLQRKKKNLRNKSLGVHFKSAFQRENRNMPKNQNEMKYSVEDIYRLVGRDDKVTILTFNPDSEAYKKFGDSCTIVFYYDIKERVALETSFRNNSDKRTFGFVKLKPLAMELSEQQIEELRNKGIHSKEIQHIFPSPWLNENPFYKEEKRKLNKIVVPFQPEPKGGDYNWMYGFYRSQIRDGVKLIPSSMDLYLAMKLFFEPEKITDEEESKIYDQDIIRNSIERKLLEIKMEKEVSAKEEDDRYFELSKLQINSNIEILKEELNKAGTNLSKLYELNTGLFHHLLSGTHLYIPEQLNGNKGLPIYLDWKGYIHVFIRHVKEFAVGERFAEKDKLLWHPKDVIPVIRKVISEVDSEIQKFWNENPTSRFSKYGVQSLYFEGDYYTFHLEADGRISTFHSVTKMI